MLGYSARMPPGTARDLVFVSYSHANPDWRNKVLVLLKPFVRQGQLQVWADPYIKTGDLWRRNIDEALERTSVGVVLLTPDLLASDFIAEVELPHLMRAALAGDVTLVVVPIESHVEGSTRFADGDLMDFQWVWPPGEPISELEDRRRPRALVTVAKAIVDSVGNRTQTSVGVSHERRSQGALLMASDRLGILHGVPAFPPNYLSRAQEHDGLKRAVLGQTPVIGVSAGVERVGVHGQGGLGKSVLAVGVAHDEDVRHTFADGIFWIPIGQQPQLEVLQAELAEHFGERSSVEDISAGARLLRARLAGKACLIILDDVWELFHAKAFDVLDVRSRLLVTTRDRSIVTALGAREMRLDVLSPDAAVDLMARWAGINAGTLSAVARDVAKEVDFLPLALSLAGAQVRDGRSWDDLLAALRAGHLEFLDHPYGSVFSSIRISVDALPSNEAARYTELAVFPEDVPVPVTVVETLWHATCGMDPRDARALLSRLASRNLLSLSQVVTMHDLQHDFVRLVVNDLVGLHRRLVDEWRTTTSIERAGSDNPGDTWAGLPESPEYPWHYLTHHLDQAGRHDALEQVLTSVEWLFARLKRFHLPAVLADFRPAVGHVALREVRDALVLSSHVLSKDPRALMGQLRGRLLGTRHMAVQRLIASPAPDGMRPFFRPVARCLTAPGGSLLQTFEGHPNGVTAVRVLPNGQRALSGGGDGTLKLWDLTSGAMLQTFEGHTGWVRAVTVLPDGRRALSAGSDGTLKLWDLTSGVVLQTFEGHTDGVSGVTVLPDGQRALSGGGDGTLKLWDLTSGAVLQTFEGHTGSVRAVTVLPDGRRALSAGDDGTLKLWDLTSGAVLHTFEGRAGWVRAVMGLPDGRRALSAGDDGTLKLWDLTSGAVLRTFEGHTFWVTAVTVLPDGQQALSASEDGTLKLWDLTSGVELQTFEGHTDAVRAVTVLPDGQRALSASVDGTLKLWDLTSGAVLQTFEGHTGRVRAVTLPDGQRALSAGDDGTLKLWDLTSGAVLQTFEGHGWVRAVTVLPDGQRALSAGSDGTLRLWDLTSGLVLRTFEGHTGSVQAVMALPDGQRGLSASFDRTLKLWDLTRGEQLASFYGDAPFTAIATSSEVVVASDTLGRLHVLTIK
jgi:WD40 repeat protein